MAAGKQMREFSLKVATLTLLAGCVILAGATHAIAQGNSQNIAQVVVLDECDPVTFNAPPPAGAGADFCRNVALGFSTTISDLFTLAEAGTPDPGWDFERQVGDQEGDHPFRGRPRR
jgi:hypothetical protein